MLRNSEGNQARIALRDFHSLGPDEAEATIALNGEAPPGEYKGQLGLGHFSGGAKIAVTLEIRHPIYWAILTVFLGSLLGGYALPRWRVKRRKEWLKEDLRAAVGEYDRLRGKKTPASWSLDRRLGPKPSSGDRWRVKDLTGVAEYHGVSGLYWRISNALTASDVEQDRVELNAIIDDIGRWLIVESSAKKLRSVAAKPPADRAGHEWRDTHVWATTQRLLVSLRRAPKPDLDVNALADGVDRHRQLYKAYRDLWNADYAARAGAPVIPAKAKAAITRIDLEALDDEFPETAMPTEEQYDELLVKITTAHERVFEDTGLPPRALDRALETAPKEALGATPPSELVQPEEFGPASSAAFAALGAVGAVSLVPFGGALSSAVETAVRALSRRQGASAKPADAAVDRPGRGTATARGNAVDVRRRRYQRLLGWTYRRDVIWTLVGALVGVVGYTLTVYGSTWGSTTDYLAAFAAGFGSSTIVRWTDLPRQDSVRRTAPVAGAGSPAS